MVLGEQVTAQKQAGPATSWATAGPVFGSPFASYAAIRSGHDAGAYTVLVATWTPAWVTAIGRPPLSFAYSTRASSVPCLASSDRPNSVTMPYRPSKRPGTVAASSCAYAACVVSSSEAKLTRAGRRRCRGCRPAAGRPPR